jgi:hypothetical protein
MIIPKLHNAGVSTHNLSVDEKHLYFTLPPVKTSRGFRPVPVIKGNLMKWYLR